MRNAECEMRISDSPRARALAKCDWVLELMHATEGSRNEKCGMRSAECGVRSAEFGIRNAEFAQNERGILTCPFCPFLCDMIVTVS